MRDTNGPMADRTECRAHPSTRIALRTAPMEDHTRADPGRRRRRDRCAVRWVPSVATNRESCDSCDASIAANDRSLAPSGRRDTMTPLIVTRDATTFVIPARARTTGERIVHEAMTHSIARGNQVTRPSNPATPDREPSPPGCLSSPPAGLTSCRLSKRGRHALPGHCHRVGRHCNRVVRRTILATERLAVFG